MQTAGKCRRFHPSRDGDGVEILWLAEWNVNVRVGAIEGGREVGEPEPVRCGGDVVGRPVEGAAALVVGVAVKGVKCDEAVCDETVVGRGGVFVEVKLGDFVRGKGSPVDASVVDFALKCSYARWRLVSTNEKIICVRGSQRQRRRGIQSSIQEDAHCPGREYENNVVPLLLAYR